MFMEENLYELIEEVCKLDVNIVEEGEKTIFPLGQDSKYGQMEAYKIFPGIILAYVDIKIKDPSDVFFETTQNGRLLEINHCRNGRYAFGIGEDKLIYFGNGDLCVSVYNLNKSISDFPFGYYNGLELFIDVDVANEYVKQHIPDFDLIEFYENLENNDGYVFIRSNEKIDHVIGELYSVDARIRKSYFKLKTLELLLFFSIANFENNCFISLSNRQVKIVEDVKKDLMMNLDSKITLDDLAHKYGISKTSLKNAFKEVYAKPIQKWRKEYKLDEACRLLHEDKYTISEISRRVGYSSPSKFTQAFKEYVGCTPSEYQK